MRTFYLDAKKFLTQNADVRLYKHMLKNGYVIVLFLSGIRPAIDEAVRRVFLIWIMTD